MEFIVYTDKYFIYNCNKHWQKEQNTKLAYYSRPHLVQKDKGNFPRYLTGNLKFKDELDLA